MFTRERHNGFGNSPVHTVKMPSLMVLFRDAPMPIVTLPL